MEVHPHQLPGHSVRPRGSDEEKHLRAHEEQLLDEALAATFPCSDPISSLSVDDVVPVDEEGQDAASRSAPEKDSGPSAQSRPD